MTTTMHGTEYAPSPVNSLDDVNRRKFASKSVYTSMQITDSPITTSRRFALGASNVYLVGENETCSVPAL